MLCSLFTDRGNLSQSFEGTSRTQLTYNHQFTGNYWHPGWLLCKSPSGYFQISSKSKLYLKKRLWHRCFLWTLRNFKEQLFLQNTSGRLLLNIYLFIGFHFVDIFVTPCLFWSYVEPFYWWYWYKYWSSHGRRFWGGVYKNFGKFTSKHLCQSLFFNEIVRLKSATLKKRLRHRCFPRNFSKFLRNFFSKTPPSDCCCKYLDISCNFL